MASLIVTSTRDEVLEGWGLLCVLAGGVAALHIAKFTLKGPSLNQLLYMPPQHLPHHFL